MNFVRYEPSRRKEWDDFLSSAKNGHFFFYRDYMDYHSDRFIDFSLMVYDGNGKLIALLPANRDGGVVHSHQGLTFGGFIIDDKMKTELMLDVFECLMGFLKGEGVEKIVYKCIPYIYHEKPSEEDRYALFVNNALLIRRDVTSTVDLLEPIRYSKGRK